MRSRRAGSAVLNRWSAAPPPLPAEQRGDQRVRAVHHRDEIKITPEAVLRVIYCGEEGGMMGPGLQGQGSGNRPIG